MTPVFCLGAWSVTPVAVSRLWDKGGLGAWTGRVVSVTQGTYLDTTPGAELMHAHPRSPEGVIAADASSLLLRQSDLLEGENDGRQW